MSEKAKSQATKETTKSGELTIEGGSGSLTVYVTGNNGAGHTGDVHMMPFNGGTLSFKPVVEAPWRVSFWAPGSMGAVSGYLDDVGPNDTVCIHNVEEVTKSWRTVISAGSCPKE